MNIKVIIWIFLIGLNLLTFFMMAYDKKQAQRKGWRVPEKRLLFLAGIGGGVGGFCASRLFHHKTQKKRFTMTFLLGAVVLLFWLWVSVNL